MKEHLLQAYIQSIQRYLLGADLGPEDIQERVQNHWKYKQQSVKVTALSLSRGERADKGKWKWARDTAVKGHDADKLTGRGLSSRREKTISEDGGRGGDKLDGGAIASKASAATGTEAGASQACPQAVPTTGGEGVAAAPTETQASASDAAAAVATGNSGGDHSCRKRGDVVRIKGRREDTWGVR